MGDMVDTMVMDSDTTARGLLMLSLRPRLILTTLVDTMVDTSDMPDISDMDMAMDSDTDTDLAIGLTTARGLLMLSLRPRLILTTMVDMVSDMPDMPDMDMDTTDMDTDLDMAMVCMDTESRLHQDLSVNQQLELRQKWIVISLNFPSPVLQFQCYH